MWKSLLVLGVVFAAMCGIQCGGEKAGDKASSGAEVRRPSAAAIQAWQDRKFGMFIHWGLYSIPAGVWKGKRITKGYSEQIQSHGRIPKQEYAALAARFNPEKWDPAAIVRLAREAGMKFIVITAKHHDGFNMFHTRQTDYNVVDATPYGKDVIRGLADACAKAGMGFGVYYSTIDWHYPDASGPEPRNNNPIPPKHAAFNVRQLRELVTGYGPLTELWFDMGDPTLEQSTRFAETVHRVQPDCMVSGRVFNHQGDFTVMGDNQIPDHIIDEPWQTPASIYHDTWGYRSWAARDDLDGKIAEHTLNLIRVVSRGGNYLLNIGPRGDGSVVEFETAVLHGVGAWLRVNGEAIYGSRPQPFRNLDFGYATTKPGRLYLLVTQWPANGYLELPGLKNEIRKAWLLADPKQRPLPVDGARVKAPAQRPTPPATVIVVEFAGELRVIPETVKANGEGVVTLDKGQAKRFWNYNGGNYWEKKSLYKLVWDLALDKGGQYEVVAVTGAGAGEVEFTIAGQKLRGSLEPGGNVAGLVTLPASEHLTLTVTPPTPFAKGDRLGADFERIILRPVK